MNQATTTLTRAEMEHSIRAPFAGVVAELLYASGEQVAEGMALIRLDPADPLPGAA